MNGGTGRLDGRQGGEIKTRGGEIEFNGGKAGLWRRGWNGGGVRVVGSAQGICKGILYTRNMDNVTGKLSAVGQVALPGGPGWRRAEQGLHQRFVVSEQGELSPVQKEMEVTNCRVSSQEIPVEGGVRSCLAWWKVESSTGDQWRDFPGPLRTSVRGARTPAGFCRNLW